MQIKVTREWCESKARLEAGAEIGAGIIAADPIIGHVDERDHATEESHQAFRRFVELRRRSLGVSIEKLAEQADVDVGELLNIESDAHFLPETRTLYQLSQVFGVSHQKLMGLSGLTQPKDVSYVKEAVRYAAKSGSIEELTPEEQAALDGLISVLSEK